MIKLQKNKDVRASFIRIASEQELSNYEKAKLAMTGGCSHQSNHDAIRVDGTVTAGSNNENKAGSLAFKTAIISGDTTNNELFFIRCL